MMMAKAGRISAWLGLREMLTRQASDGFAQNFVDF